MSTTVRRSLPLFPFFLMVAGCLGNQPVPPDGGSPAESSFVPTSLKPVLISYGPDAVGNHVSDYPSLSRDAGALVFETLADNLFDDRNHGCPRDERFTSKVTCADAVQWSKNIPAIRPVSLSNSGQQANDNSRVVSISDDGTRVAFFSDADNLVEGDLNGIEDVFVRDLATGKTQRVSVASNSSEQERPRDPGGRDFKPCEIACGWPAISPTGRFVIFPSWSSNLVPDDTNDLPDVFLRDTLLRRTERVSLTSGRGQAVGFSTLPSAANVASSDGRYVLFETTAALVAADANSCPNPDVPVSELNGPTCVDVYRMDRVAGLVELVDRSVDGGPPRRGAWFPSLSADGRLATYQSDSDDIVPGDSNGRYDTFLFDFATNTTTRISVSSTGQELDQRSRAPKVSLDGNRVLFATASAASPQDVDGLDDAYVFDRVSGAVVLVSGGNGADVRGASISPDGQWVAFSTAAALDPRDTNGLLDVYLTFVP